MFFLATDYTNLPRWITLIEKLMCNKKKISYGVSNLSLLLKVSSNKYVYCAVGYNRLIFIKNGV